MTLTWEAAVNLNEGLSFPRRGKCVMLRGELAETLGRVIIRQRPRADAPSFSSLMIRLECAKSPLLVVLVILGDRSEFFSGSPSSVYCWSAEAGMSRSLEGKGWLWNARPFNRRYPNFNFRSLPRGVFKSGARVSYSTAVQRTATAMRAKCAVIDVRAL